MLNLENSKNSGIRHILDAFRYTYAGLKAAWINEWAFRLEIILLVVVVPLGLWMGTSSSQRAILIGSYFIIPLTELLNSAIESMVDRIGRERHELSRRAKDMGSAAVFLAICTALIVWLIIAYDCFL